MELYLFQKGFNYSQDGPGNRLIYHLQGCNIRCPWCSNPEGIPRHIGTKYTVDALLDEAVRSKMMFFDGGGVTLTGGEVTMQFDAVKALLAMLHAEGIHTCIETNGICKRLPELFPVLDLLIMDIKHYDPHIHQQITGLSNQITIENITNALSANQQLALRIPLIGGFNASESDAMAFATLFQKLGVVRNATVELLPYHEYGKDKYRSLGLEYTMTESAKISTEQLARYRRILEDIGITIIHT